VHEEWLYPFHAEFVQGLEAGQNNLHIPFCAMYCEHYAIYTYNRENNLHSLHVLHWKNLILFYYFHLDKDLASTFGLES
jgi:hypothetical protein